MVLFGFGRGLGLLGRFFRLAAVRQPFAVGVDVGHELVARDGLLAQQVHRDLVKKRTVLDKKLFRVRVAVHEQLMDLFVRRGGGGVGAVHHRAAIEIRVRDGGQRHEAELVAHAVLRDHLAGQLRRTLNVVRRAGRSDAEDDLLGSAAAQHGLKLDDQLFPAGQELFLLRHLHGVAQCAGGVRDDGDLGDGL